MTEKDDALGDLGDAAVLKALCWAWDSAAKQALDSYEPTTGHDQGWVGYTAWKFFTDRLDRVFSCERFFVHPDDPFESGGDLVAEGLLSGEYKAMPRLTPGLVVRDDLHGSPGWRYKEWRFLLQSFGGKDVDSIPWPQARPTKRAVAAQPYPDEMVLPGFEQLMAIDVLADVFNASTNDFTVVTLVAAWAIDAHTKVSALHLGRPRYNRKGSEAWHWRVELRNGPPEGRQSREPISTTPPKTPPPQDARDVEVTLRATPREANSQKE
ncbi:hypothetical protein ACLQ2R_20450 [Streptosporangium sp. DT93]|uniref:hypothetical protein n=1 Tax=Streptosporangium sp. DT93 TaxID=3393428 RepID=UPI003CED1941